MNRSTTGLMFLTTMCLVGFLESTSFSGGTLVSDSTSQDMKGTTTADVPAPSPDVPADNTKKNVRDKDDATLTPPDQAQGSDNDVEVTRRIRKALVADEALSTNAKNVKIITLNGQVTLRGPVENKSERKSVMSKAKKVAGAKNVKSELEVKRP
jgi:hyperosmotically inducible periplasmic protein